MVKVKVKAKAKAKEEGINEGKSEEEDWIACELYLRGGTDKLSDFSSQKSNKISKKLN